MSDKLLKEGSIRGLLAYLDALIVGGKFSAGQILPLKTAVSKVISTVAGARWLEQSVHLVSIEEYMRRFVELTDTNYSTQSLSAYKSRITKALNWYIRFLDDNPDWTPTTRKSRSSPISLQELYAASAATESHSPRIDRYLRDKSRAFITYPFPLQKGRVARLILPAALSADEAARLNSFIDSLVVKNGEGGGM